MKVEAVKNLFQRVARASALGETMVCIQAHNDDFDISLSGIAREYDTVIIVTVTDVGTGHYELAREQELIPCDGEVNKAWISPEGHEWTQDFHSLSLSDHRIRTMEERYNHYQYISVRPDTRVPDVITYNASLEIQLEYLRQVSQEIAIKLQDLKVTDYDLFIHDPELPEHLDHEFSGLIGSRVNRLVPSRRLFYFYVYTVFRLPRYMLARVEEHLDHKTDIFSRIWEKEDLPLRMWDKDPAEDDDKYFRNELIMTAVPQKVGEVLIPRRIWTPLFKLLRKIRIYLGL
jgi:hypothetical protein